MFGRKGKKRKNVFDLPFDESVKRLSNIVDDVYHIVNNKNFVGAMDKSIKLPKNATVKDIEAVWYGDEIAGKIKGFLNVFLVDEREAIINIISTLFCEPKETYRKKSVNEILDDLASLSSDEKGRFIAFFTRA